MDHQSNNLTDARAAFTREEFCKRNSISLSSFNKLVQTGRAPALMRLGPLMIRITAEAEREWQRMMESPVGAEAELQSRMRQKAILRGQKAGGLSVMSAAHPANVKRARRNLAYRAQEFAAARGRKSETV